MVYVFFADGFEEIEAITVVDVLRRANIDVKSVGVPARAVTGAHGIPVTADCALDDIRNTEPDMVVIPGGMGGVNHLGECRDFMDMVKKTAKDGRYVAAICAAPTLLGRLGLLDGRTCVCYPGMEAYLGKVGSSPERAVVRDGKLITSKGPGTAADFALEIVKVLKDEKTAESVRHSMCHRRYD